MFCGSSSVGILSTNSINSIINIKNKETNVLSFLIIQFYDLYKERRFYIPDFEKIFTNIFIVCRLRTVSRPYERANKGAVK